MLCCGVAPAPGDTESLDEVSFSASPQAAAGDTAEAPIRPGDCLGRFSIRERIGAGGMGEVFSAHDAEPISAAIRGGPGAACSWARRSRASLPEASWRCGRSGRHLAAMT